MSMMDLTYWGGSILGRMRHVCFGGKRGVKMTSVSAAIAGVSQSGVMERNLMVVDIGDTGVA